MGDHVDDYQRIKDATDPYDILDLQRPTTERAVNESYKKLAIKFHPDKLRMAVKSAGDEREKLMADMVLQEGTRLFKKIQEAAEDVKNELSRARSGRTSPKTQFSGRTSPRSTFSKHSSDALVAYTKPPHMSDAPPPPYRRAPTVYDEPEPVDHFGNRSRPPSFDDYAQQQQQRPKPSSRMGSDLGFGPQSHDDPFALFPSMPGFGAGKSGDIMGGGPEDMFANFFGGSKMGSNEMFGSGGNGTPDANDMLMQMMGKMGMGGGGQEMQMPPSGMGMRGGFASHTITRRHTGRDGRETMDKQHRSMAMMDHGEHGKVMVESSYRIRSVTPGRGGSHALTDGGAQDFGRPSSASMDPYAPHRPPRSRRMSTSGLSSHAPSSYGGSGGGHSGYLPSSGDAFGLDRMIAPSPMSRDMMPFGRSGSTDLQHMPRPLSTVPYSGGYGGYH